MHHRARRDDNAEALKHLERAIALDPDYAHAHAWKACTLGQSYVYGWCADANATGLQIMDELRLAQSLDENDSDVHRILAAANLAVYHDHERAMHHQERALALNPNDDLIVVQQGEMLTWFGRAEEGIEWILKAMRLNPYHPERFWNHLGRAYFVARRYAESAAAFGKIARPDAGQLAFLASCRAALEDAPGAQALAQAVLAQAPNFTATNFLATQHYKHEGDREHHRALLLKTGLPA